MIPHLRHNQKGFTLVEILFVLIIFLALLAISVPIQSHSKMKVEEERFFSQFEEDILYMQSMAITKGTILKLTFYPNSYYYELREGGLNKLIKRRRYASHIKVALEAFHLPFSFYTSGTPNQPGSFKVTVDDNVYRITFPFGKGRYYVTKQ